jgi:hypothetical protein
MALGDNSTDPTKPKQSSGGGILHAIDAAGKNIGDFITGSSANGSSTDNLVNAGKDVADAAKDAKVGQGAVDATASKDAAGVTGRGSSSPSSTPATLSTEGLKEGTNYTYKNGKLTEYTPPAATPATQNYGLDPLSMATIMSQSIDPELASLNKQFSTSANTNDKLLSTQLANDKSLGIPASSLALIQAGNQDVTGANQAALIGNEKAGIAGAPIDALVTALGQSADAARLAGYEAEYGQAANGSGSSANSTAASVADLIASLGSQPSS